MENKYIHYGHCQFDRDRFVSIQNITMFPKPHGGMWASRVDAEFGWKQWCEQENFRECCEDNSFMFTLKPDAKVIHIYRVSDLDVLPMQDCFGEFSAITMCCPDFEKILSDGWDAIELHLSEEDRTGVGYLEGLYWKLYGWDCDSILVMNPEVIVV